MEPIDIKLNEHTGGWVLAAPTGLEKFESFPSIKRLTRGCIITEKIDGTNAQICFDVDGTMRVGSRNRWITPADDNFGFASWCVLNEQELRKLGTGRHYGEWYGAGIQRRYGLTTKRLALFRQPKDLPACCEVVPTLYTGDFSTEVVDQWMEKLRRDGSVAVPGFMQPEGVVMFHTQTRSVFKKTLDGDGHKGAK